MSAASRSSALRRRRFRCFLATDMDALVLEDFVLRKEEIDPAVNGNARQEYLAQFQLD